MDHLVEIIKALAWPIATIWVSYLFRTTIRQLVNRVSTFKYGDVEANFTKELTEAELDAKKIKAPKITSTPKTLNQKEQLLRIADISPRAAIVEAWALIEMASIKKGLTSGATIQRTNPKIIVEYLKDTGKFSSESLDLIERLRLIRNRASHMPDFAITQNEAERYLELAAQAASVIEAALG